MTCKHDTGDCPGEDLGFGFEVWPGLGVGMCQIQTKSGPDPHALRLYKAHPLVSDLEINEAERGIAETPHFIRSDPRNCGLLAILPAIRARKVDSTHNLRLKPARFSA